MDRWRRVYPVSPTRGDSPRRKLSSGNRRRHAADPNRFLEERGRIKNQTLNLSVGETIGGTIALEFAYRFPERLHTVTTAERRTGTG